MQGSTKLQELRYIIWPDAPEKQLARLQDQCPRLVINARQRAFASTAKLKLPVEADMRRPLDVEYAAMVSQLPIDETSKFQAPCALHCTPVTPLTTLAAVTPSMSRCKGEACSSIKNIAYHVIGEIKTA